jgi:hypothetical protein
VVLSGPQLIKLLNIIFPVGKLASPYYLIFTHVQSISVTVAIPPRQGKITSTGIVGVVVEAR